MATEVGPIKATLKTDTSGFDGAMSGAMGKLAGFAGVAVKAAAAVAAVGTAVVGVSTKLAGDFQQALAVAASKTENGDQHLAAFRKRALQVGRDTAFSAKEAAEGLGFLAQAGFTAQQQITALQPITNLAAAEAMALGDATELTTGVLRGFGLQVSDTTRVTDVLTKASTSASTTAAQLGEAMSYVAPVSAAMGVSMEETAAAAGILADAGIKASRAGTSLRGAIGRIPQAAKKLGIQLSHADVETLGLRGSLNKLKEAGLDGKNSMELFGMYAGPGVAALLQAGDEKLKDMTETMEKAGGTAKEIADYQLATFSGQMTIMKGTMETAAITLGEVFTPMFTPFVTLLTDATNQTMEGDGALTTLTLTIAENMIPVLANLRTYLTPLLPLIEGLGKFTLVVVKVFKVLWNAITFILKALGSLIVMIGSGLLSVFSSLIEAASAGARAIGKDGLADELDAASSAIDNMNAQTREFIKNNTFPSLKKDAMDMGDAFGDMGDILMQDWSSGLIEALDKTSDAGGKAADNLREYVRSLKESKKESAAAGAAGALAPAVAEPDDMGGFEGAFGKSSEKAAKAAAKPAGNALWDTVSGAMSKGKSAVKDWWKGLGEGDDSMGQMENKTANIVEGFNEINGSVAGLIGGLGEALGAGQKFQQVVGGISTAAGGIANVFGALSQGNVVGAIAGGIGVLTNIISMFGGKKRGGGGARVERMSPQEFGAIVGERIADKLEDRDLRPIQINFDARGAVTDSRTVSRFFDQLELEAANRGRRFAGAT